MQSANYSSKIIFDDIDKSVIEKYITRSLPKEKASFDNEDTYNKTSCKIKGIVKDIYIFESKTQLKEIISLET